MIHYKAKVDPGPGDYSVEVIAENSPGGAVHCVLSLVGNSAARNTSLRACDMDALIASLQAARRYVEQ